MNTLASQRFYTALATVSRMSQTSQTSRVLRSSLVSRRSYSSLPTVAQTSFWKSLVPKPLRRADGGGAAELARSNANAAKSLSKSGWNPATFYIFMFLFIGSMSIQSIALRRDYDTFMRRSEVKIAVLREVVERIKKGDDVDVEGMLGTGDPQQESEWEHVLKEFERDEPTRSTKRADKKTAQAKTTPRPAPVAEPQQSSIPSNPSLPKVASVSSFY